MRNKGAIWTLAIALAVVCIYQLSFTWKAASIRNAAKEYALSDSGNVESVKEQYFLDSISNEKVYFFNMFTYRDCIERELNFGLDLKGGMNIILEISVTDVLRNLSATPNDSTLNAAIRLAKQKELNSAEDFITLFGKSFEEIAPGGALGGLFRTKELASQIKLDATNADVIKVLRSETDDAINNAFNIIRARIDQFGVAQPNIQQLETAGRILVDLPGVKDKERVRKLLQNTAHLEFWETYENSELQQSLLEVNRIIKEHLDAEKAMNEKDVVADVQPETLEPETPEVAEQDSANSLLSMVEEGEEGDSSLTPKESMYPLFEIMSPMINMQTGEPYPGCIVGMAHFKDTAKVNQYLKMAIERNALPRDVKLMWGAKARQNAEKESTNYFELYAIKSSREGKPALDGEVITAARQQFDQTSGSAHVSMTMNSDGAKDWARLTKANIKKSIAIVMDDQVYSAPTVQGEITGGSSQITGNFSIQEADDLANLLKSGKLPAPARIIQETVVGPSLGADAVSSGLNSFLIAFLVILVYMLFYYSKNAGLVADIALIVNMFFIIGVLASLGAALTLPGIAGIVLTIGMSVDANVLIYERIREELLAGKGLKLAIKDGYKHAYSAIIDANVTTLVTAIILLVLGTGPIKGFATTLVIGICTSLFTAIFITRLIIEKYLTNNKDFKFSTKMTEGAFSKTNIKFLDIRKTPYVVSGILVILSLVSIFGLRGLDLGVDFKGGRNYILNFEKPVDNQTVAKALTPVFNNDAPSVIQYGSEDQVRVTTLYRIDDEGRDVDEQIQHEIYDGLTSILGDVSYEKFSEDILVGSQKVGATIADDIKRESLWVFGLALLLMFIYIFARFSNWQFGLGAVLALLHDSIIVLGFFSLLQGILPFSLEIDQAFIAAILTVIGYSVNDTVVVFDRIREYLGLYPKRERREIMNMALNSTLSRTFNTSISTFVVLLTIFILGGEAIQGFTFALMVGVVVGTYSSLFIATPLVYDTVFKKESQNHGKKKS